MNKDLKSTPKKKSGCFKIGLIILVIFTIFIIISSIIGGGATNTDKNSENTIKDSIVRIEELNNNIESNILELNKKKDLDKFSQNDLMLIINTNKKLVEEGINSKIDSINEKSVKLKNEVIKFQESNFPIIRRKYTNNLNSKLWEENIEVKCLNKSCTKIEYIGSAFANNKNIKKAYEAMSNDINELRFKQVNFKWIKHDDEYTYFTIDSKTDKEY